MDLSPSYEAIRRMAALTHGRWPRSDAMWRVLATPDLPSSLEPSSALASAISSTLTVTVSTCH